MTEKTLSEQGREIAQKLVNLEIERKSIVDEVSELKEKFFELVEQGVDSTYDLPNGQVFISNTISYKIPDGLKQEVESKVKNPEKLSPELIKEYFNPDLKLSRKAMKTLRNSADPDLSKLVIQDEKAKLTIKVS